VIFDQQGNIYDTTEYGGGPQSTGTVFELIPIGGGWNETVLHRFMGGEDGAYVIGGVNFDDAGNLYGTTQEGGANNAGTVFELTQSQSGWSKSILHSFHGLPDGEYPAAVSFLTAPEIYMVIQPRGQPANAGAVFQLTPSNGNWTFGSLYNLFVGNVGPEDTLALDATGNLYGTTPQDGAYQRGSVFKLTHGADGSWTYSDLHDFTGGSDGGFPTSSVIVDDNGNIFGTALSGG
jgi:uncharacterized repeat protein (TIGR03803 family)